MNYSPFIKYSTGTLIFLLTGAIHAQQTDVGWSGYVEKAPVVHEWKYGQPRSEIIYSSEQEVFDLIIEETDSSNTLLRCGMPSSVTRSGEWQEIVGGFGLAYSRSAEITITQYFDVSVSRDCTDVRPNVSVNIISSSRHVACPIDTSVKRINSTNVCVDETTLSSSCSVGNPCSPLTGDKIAIERDIASIGGLSFSRTYHSKNLALSDIGVGWKHNYMRRWVPAFNGVGGYFETASGYQYPMVWSSSSKKYISVNKQGYSIEEFEDTWILTKPSKDREIYSQNGRLLRTETNDYVIELTYQQDKLTKVENSYGQNLLIKYNDQGQLESITDAFGAIYSYQYDLVGNLSEVIYPDLTISDDSDNPRKVYHYEDEAFPNNLTGITDENGDRYATYSYDVNGKATSTEHAATTNTAGQERFKLDYQGAN